MLREVFAISSIAAILGVAAAQSALPAVNFEPVLRVAFDSPASGLYRSLKGGMDYHILTVDPPEIHRIGRAGARTRLVSLSAVPDFDKHNVTLKDMSVDSSGGIFAGATYGLGKGSSDRVYVFDNLDRYGRTVLLKPSFSLRRLAVDDKGLIYVLATDPRYFKGRFARLIPLGWRPRRG